MLIVLFTAFLLFSATASVEFDYPEALPDRNIRGDVPSVFFSPFRMVGKRSQFYGLYKQLEKADPIR